MLDFAAYLEQAVAARQCNLAQSSQKTHMALLQAYDRTMETVFKIAPRPLTEDKMQGFIMYKKSQGVKFNSLMGYVRAFSWDLRRNNLPLLTQSLTFKNFKDTLRREMNGGECPNQKSPMPQEFFTKFLEHFPVTFRDHRLFFFIASLSFNFFLRISEALEMRKKDVRLADDGKLLEVTVRRSKSDQFAKGAVSYIPVTDDETNPAQYLDVLDAIGEEEKIVSLTAGSLNSRLRSYLTALGFDRDKFSWHSFRRGAYLASINDVQDCVIKKHGRWSSERT